MRAEFIEDAKREQIQCLEDSGEKRESPLCLGSEVFVEDSSLGYVSSQASGNWLKQGQVLRCPL